MDPQSITTKIKIEIPTNSGLCINCFNLRKEGSKYCGKCLSKRKPIFYDKQSNFPILSKIKEKFPINDNVILTYDNTIYTNSPLSYHLLTHEITHIIQQQDNTEKWWKEYLENNKFRLSQELEAYHRQYLVVIDNVYKTILLEKIASDLSSNLYGNIISFEEAKSLIIKFK